MVFRFSVKLTGLFIASDIAFCILTCEHSHFLEGLFYDHGAEIPF